MARSLLSTAVYVLALISFVGVQGNSINTGKKYIHGSTGSGSKGVDGDCRQTEIGEKCGNVICRPDEKCEYAVVKCQEGVVCPQPPPKCFPKKTTPPVGEKCGNVICRPDEKCEYAIVKCKEGVVCPQPPPKCFPKKTTPPVGEKCGNTICKPNETCRVILINCLAGSTCIPPPPKCVPKNPCDKKTCKKGYDCVPNKNNPTIANCVRKSCATVKCQAGYTCKMVTVQCIRAPCPPIPQCLPINPCKNKKCSEGYVCTQTKNDPTVAKCVLTPCAIVRCGFNTTCMSFTEYCKYAPCAPPKAKCVPRTDENPCALVRCRKGYYCENVPVSNCEKVSCPTTRAECKLRPKQNISSGPCANNKCQHGYTCQKNKCRRPGCRRLRIKCVRKNPYVKKTYKKRCDCVPNKNNPTVADGVRDPCANVKCQRGYKCTFFAFNCLVPPCPRYYTECVPINPCSYTTCLEGYTCVPSKNDPTVAKCVPQNPCATVLCKPGYRCESVNVQCIRAPCPPRAQCVPINPCKNTTCSEGNVCTQTENDPTVAKCVLTPCATVRCGYNTTCMSFTEYCKYAPCNPPKAKCVPRTDENPCALVRCRKGYYCENVPVSNCEKVSCPTTRAECKLRPKNPCHNYLCPKGYNCKVDQNNKAVCYKIKQCH